LRTPELVRRHFDDTETVGLFSHVWHWSLLCFTGKGKLRRRASTGYRRFNFGNFNDSRAKAWVRARELVAQPAEGPIDRRVWLPVEFLWDFSALQKIPNVMQSAQQYG